MIGREFGFVVVAYFTGALSAFALESGSKGRAVFWQVVGGLAMIAIIVLDPGGN